MENQTHSKPYKKLAVSLLVSFFIMYAVMFLNVSEMNHIYLSLTRFYMALLMVCPMAVLMILLMNKMYNKKKLNLTIVLSGILIFFLSLFLLRKQIPINDVQYMKAMIPHHSSAILTSSNAHIKDPEVRKLADDIIAAQEREIAQMKEMIQRLENNN